MESSKQGEEYYNCHDCPEQFREPPMKTRSNVVTVNNGGIKTQVVLRGIFYM
jgi:hypothetical protein